MPSQEPSRREVEFSGLNWFGKTVFVSGQIARVAGTVIESVVDQAAAILTDAERAFREGLGPEIEDAKVIEEIDEPRKGRTSSSNNRGA